MPVKVIVVGARSARQGTGPYVVSALTHLGADVCAVIGTSESTVQQAQLALKSEQGIACRGYTDLAEAITTEQPDAVVICSPYTFHAQQLATVALAGCHCLVEKPLAWPISESDVTGIISNYTDRGLLLQMVNQWPHTLETFKTLYGPLKETIRDFTMALSPISIGPNMVPDSAPHFISMLQALVGPGECEQIEVKLQHSNAGDPCKLVLQCNYNHQQGQTQAQLLLTTCETRPRPAWYEINGRRADRQVELPQYIQSLSSQTQRVKMQDPLEGVVRDFLGQLESSATTDVETLLAGHRNLTQLTRAWPNSR